MVQHGPVAVPTYALSLSRDALSALLRIGPTLASVEEQAELLGLVPRPPVAISVRLAPEEALGAAMTRLEVDQVALASRWRRVTFCYLIQI